MVTSLQSLNCQYNQCQPAYILTPTYKNIIMLITVGYIGTSLQDVQV